jgi:phenylacetate-CoA ligase
MATAVAERPTGSYRPQFEEMPPAALRDLQERKLRSQLAYVWDRSPFYREKLSAAGVTSKDVRTIDDLAHVPFTTKDELRASQLAQPPLGAHAAASMDEVVRVHASSGTTGHPSYIGVTKHDAATWAESVARAYYSQGVRPSSIVVLGFGIGFFVGGIAVEAACETIGATVVPIGVGASDRLVSAFENLGADQLTCTPSYARYLAEYVQTKLGRDPRELGVERIFLGAEPGGGVPAVRAHLEELWGGRVSESIGNGDVIPVYAGDCEERTGAHFQAPDLVIMEVIDPDTGRGLSLQEPEVHGELVFTHIDRECVPLVRFRSRDLAVVRTGPCPCGRTGPRLRVVGRTDDLLIVRGVNVWPSAVKDVITSLRPLTTGEFEILLRAPPPVIDGPLHLRVEYGDGAADVDAVRRKVAEEMRGRLIVATEVEMVPPGTLPRFEMKAKLIRKLYKEG